MTALLGCDPTMRGGPYRRLQQLRVWQTALTDEDFGAAAEVLRSGGEEVQLSSLELVNCGAGPLAAAALGGALSRGMNLSLTQLKLDFNSTLGSEGASSRQCIEILSTYSLFFSRCRMCAFMPRIAQQRHPYTALARLLFHWLRPQRH